MTPQNPDCEQGKHDACNGDSWNDRLDDWDNCPCDCHQQITVYTKPSCVQCDSTKRYLERNRIPFTETPITDQIADVARARGILAAPVVVQGDTMFGGFQPDALAKLVA